MASVILRTPTAKIKIRSFHELTGNLSQSKGPKNCLVLAHSKAVLTQQNILLIR